MSSHASSWKRHSRLGIVLIQLPKHALPVLPSRQRLQPPVQSVLLPVPHIPLQKVSLPGSVFVLCNVYIIVGVIDVIIIINYN